MKPYDQEALELLDDMLSYAGCDTCEHPVCLGEAARLKGRLYDLLAQIDLDARIDVLYHLPIAGKLDPSNGLRVDHVPAEVVRERLHELQELRGEMG